MIERWTLRLILDTPEDEKKLNWLVATLQKDAHVDHVNATSVHGFAGHHSAIDVTFNPGETEPASAQLRGLNHVFGDGGVHRPSKWDLLLADDELSGV